MRNLTAGELEYFAESPVQKSEPFLTGDDDPLFVAELNPELKENFEKPKLMRQFGLILEEGKTLRIDVQDGSLALMSESLVTPAQKAEKPVP